MVEKYKDEWISILDDSVLALKFKRWSGVSGKIYFVSNILHHVNNELSHILLLQRSICKWNIMCFNLMFLPNSSFIWCTLFPLRLSEEQWESGKESGPCHTKCKCELCRETNFDARVSLVSGDRTKRPVDVPPCLTRFPFAVSEDD